MIERPAYQFIYSGLLLAGLFLLGWPCYRYIFDVDGIGYASVADHYANGQWKQAVNGYWSPLHSWLIVPLLKAGMEAPLAFKCSNALFAWCILLIFQRHLQRSPLGVTVRFVALLTAVIILTYYTWFELAADLLLALLLMVYFSITLTDDFTQNRKANVLSAVIGALAYMAKAYALPLFLLHFTLIHLLFHRGKPEWKNLITGISVFMLLCLPWILALYWKYDAWMIGTSGKLNWSWYLSEVRNTRLDFYPPPHALSPGAWEDPWYLQESFHTPFDSLSMFFHQLRVILYNIQQWWQILFQQSFLAPAILVCTWLASKRTVGDNANKLWFFCLLLPAGYLLIHIEERFLWASTLLLMLAGAYLVHHLIDTYKLKGKTALLLWIILFGSFLAEPINWLKDHRNHQRALVQIAESLHKHQVNGSFTSNTNSEECLILAYQEKLNYYTPSSKKQSQSYFIRKAKETGIKHYLFFYDSEEEKNRFLQHPEILTAVRKTEALGKLIIVTF